MITTPTCEINARDSVAPTTVFDSLRWAWDESGQDCLGGLDRDFVTRHRSALDLAALSLIAPHLEAAWAVLGYGVEFVAGAEAPVTDGVDHETYRAVADTAAAAIHPDDLLAKAGLTGEYRAYVEGQ